MKRGHLNNLGDHFNETVRQGKALEKSMVTSTHFSNESPFPLTPKKLVAHLPAFDKSHLLFVCDLTEWLLELKSQNIHQPLLLAVMKGNVM